jgi:tetratricopeptide (TPR) repeat protein
MKVHRILIPILALLLSSDGYGQVVSQGVESGPPTVRAEANAAGVFREDLARRIAFEEAAVRREESEHAPDVEVARTYAQLGLLYQDAAQWARSEAVMEHALSLLRHAPEPGETLAAILSQLGVLHVMMGKLRESEKEEQEGLKLRQQLGDHLQIAQSWNNLAALSLSQHKYEKARDYAQEAVAEFVANGRASAVDRITARYTLGLAICYLKDCLAAVPVIRAAVDEAKAQLGPNDFPIGVGIFLLGYTYWKSGNMLDAAPYLADGTSTMSRQLGWGHPTYLSALRQYAQFLHENRQVDAADVVERRIRQAEAVVDVHSIQAGQGMFRSDGLR